MRFTKMEGLGNDFIVVSDPDLEPIDWAQAAVGLCDRRRGIGADGVLLVGPSRVNDLRMRLINADGSEAEMCGNGVRCVALLAASSGRAGREVMWETGAGPVRTELVDGGLVRVDMGEPRFAPAEVPVDVAGPDALDLDLEAAGRRWHVAALGMGNPHCVVEVDDVDAAPVETLGIALQTHPLFPRRTNVEFVQVVSRTRVRQRTFERGVGETDACGTGACASAVALHARGRTGSAVDVELRGGVLRIEWPGSGPVLMTGPARAVYTGEVEVVAMAGSRR